MQALSLVEPCKSHSISISMLDVELVPDKSIVLWSAPYELATYWHAVLVAEIHP